MDTKASTAMSAILLTFSASLSEVRQIVRKASPVFLFAAPWYSSTTPCTISAIWFTKPMTSAWSTSVAMLKFWIRLQPMMHSTLVPSTITTTLALSAPRRLCAMMLAPASPKPRASRDPSLMIVFSRITVSMISVPEFLGLHRTVSIRCFSLLSCCLFSFTFCASSILNSSSATRMAAKGSFRKVSTLEIMFSTGVSTSLFASPEKNSDTIVSDRQTNSVVSREYRLSFRTKIRLSK
mmetsp:Transcript_33110/g.95179  ORF Transcript_33110/g.95179 Transcript_33110/m.95179 type:complete len:237 (-) Transcript_33110:1297-2007(-)